MMIVGVLISAISGGGTALAISLAHGDGLAQALLSYPLGGMLAITAFAALNVGRQDTGRY
ncbi:MAG: hypothetical protein V4586_17630 [Pseudomonadota bacterium]